MDEEAPNKNDEPLIFKLRKSNFSLLLYGVIALLAVVIVLLLVTPSSPVTATASAPAAASASSTLYGSTGNPIARGNWLTSVGVNWFGAGWYMLNNQAVYFNNVTSMQSAALGLAGLAIVVGMKRKGLFEMLRGIRFNDFKPLMRNHEE